MRNEKGFTLVELIIVMAIMCIMVTILVVQWTGARQAAYDSEALSTARNVSLAAQIFYARNDLSYIPGSGASLLEELVKIEPSLVGGGATVSQGAEPTKNEFHMIVVAKGVSGKTYHVTETGVSDMAP